MGCTKRLLHFFIGVTISVSSQLTHANNSNASSLVGAANLCKSELPDAEYLEDLRASALEVRKTLCLGTGTQRDVFKAFVSFLVENRAKWFTQYGKYEDGLDPLDAVLEDALATQVVDSYSPFAVSVSPSDNVTVNGVVLKPIDTSDCPDEGCGPVFDEFSLFYTYAQNTIASPGAQAVANSLAGLSTQWDQYLKESRSQTPLELTLNSLLYKRSDATGFGPPPPGQIIFMHPGVVIENVSEAVDGQQTQEALMVEIIGYNRWKHKRPYAITGVSVSALYTDRAGIDSVGYGVSLHMGNKFTVGYSRRSGADGIYMSIDLLKPLQDKAKLFDELTR